MIARLARRVLVVDVSHEIADVMALFLQSCGFTTAVAYDGQKAFDIARIFCPNVVILALNLPGMDGFELARRLRLMPGPTKPFVIALTFMDGLDDIVRAKAFGFDYYFVKPVDPKEIAKLLAELNPGD